MGQPSHSLSAAEDSVDVTCCRVVTARVVALKQTLASHYELQGVPVELIRQAVAIAEPEAWLSGFPHLFLPGLVEESLSRLLQRGASIHPDYAQAA